VEIAQLGMARLQVAITDMGTPQPHDLDRAVAFMDAALHLGGTVYVHCRAGVQRTGAIAAAWYARRQGCSAAEAVARLRERRPDLEPMTFQLAAAQSWLAQQKSTLKGFPRPALKGFLEARLRPPRPPLPAVGEGETTGQ
jgi:protein-tyrosine phosphatase